MKATVSFNRTLCERARLAPLDFDGLHDSIYQPYDLAGDRYMEYLHDYGHFADVPYDDIVQTFARCYPNMQTHGRDGRRPGGRFCRGPCSRSG